VAQAIPIVIAPILSRMYAPEQFGELGVILSLVGIFSIIATFQYESAIMLPKEDEDALNLLSLSIFLTVFVSTLAWGITQFFGDEIGRLLKFEGFAEWAFIVPILVFLTGLFNALNIWASRQKQFKRLAFRQIAQTFVGAGTKVILGWMKYLSSGLIWGSIAGQFTSTTVLAVMTYKETRPMFGSISIERMKKNAILYQDFPKYSMWQGFFDLVNASGIIFILSSFYGVAVVGLYTFTLALLLKPTKMIGRAVSQVFYQSASKKVASNEPIYKDTVRLVKNLGLVGAIIFLPTLVAGPYLFSFVFGEKWWDAGIIAQIISPWIFMRFVASPLARLAMIKNKQKQFLFVTTGMNLLLPSIFLTIGWLQLNYTTAFYFSSAIMALYLSATIVWVLSFTKEKTRT